MTANQTIRAAFIAIIVYLGWRVILPLTDTTWTIVLTVIAEIIFFAVLTYVVLMTSGGAHRSPSAVRDRIAEAIKRQQARIPK